MTTQDRNFIIMVLSPKCEDSTTREYSGTLYEACREIREAREGDLIEVGRGLVAFWCEHTQSLRPGFAARGADRQVVVDAASGGAA